MIPLFQPDATEPIAEGAILLRGFASSIAEVLIKDIREIEAASPFRHMVTRGGFRMSVAMTNCGDVGWVTDRRGYRYEPLDPETGRAWPPMPASFQSLARNAAADAGFPAFQPDACLINRYEPRAKMSLHQDRDESDFTQPIVSVSLGLAALFLFGGEKRSDKTRRIPLESGDVVVWGGASRLFYHGVEPLAAGAHPLTGSYRFNLTFRKAR